MGVLESGVAGSQAGSEIDWLALAARTAHVAVGITDLRTGVCVEVNDAFCRLFRMGREEILGRRSADLGIGIDAAARERMLDLVRRHGSISRFETRYRNGHGEVGDLEISARIVELGGESCLIGFLTDVTVQREIVEGLRVAQGRLDLVLRSSGMLVFHQDRQLRYTWVANPALGATSDDLIGRTDEEILGPAAATPLVAIKRRVLDLGRAERCDVWVANNGQLGCFDLVAEPERDAAGQVVGIVCSAQDITERMLGQRAALDGPVQTIHGMSALIGREALSDRQAERLQCIDRVAGRLVGRPPPLTPELAVDRLRRHHAGTTVVVAAHEPVQRELACALLEQAGLHVIPARDGVEAFSYTMQWTPALLLLDMELPQRGGVAAARALRTMLPRRIPIVALMSAASSMVATQALDADLDDVIDSPATAPLLYVKVLAWLQGR